ncbi:MAG: 2-C-methyl-D-erythritol 4-phosphate cytidylyltransferase [Deferribacteres bacterium]|nr:2-C-methyl-D-erythritol 4-phosphate cytidylyltransferase [Deferribacteres bacterium]
MRERACAVIVVAGGRGTRFGKKKQWQYLKGKPLIAYSLETLEKHPLVDAVFVGAPEEDLELARSILKKWAPTKGKGVYKGGTERKDTVYNGLMKASHYHIIGIHDAARPFASKNLIEKLISALTEDIDGTIPVLSIHDTIKEVEGGLVKRTLDRKRLCAVQTPQFFHRESIITAYEKTKGEDSKLFTDDASVVEYSGGKIKAVEGEALNFKITTPSDWQTAEKLLCQPRIGWGYDIHRTKEGDGIWLGGVFIPCGFSLTGHSDSDPLLHALVDALLGASSLGDIGEWFPDTDPAYKGKESSFFVKEVVKQIKDRWCISNVDATIIAEKPKLSPYKEKIRQNIAELLGITPDKVNIKAKTKEGLDSTGKGEAIECVVCLTLL